MQIFLEFRIVIVPRRGAIAVVLIGISVKDNWINTLLSNVLYFLPYVYKVAPQPYESPGKHSLWFREFLSLFKKWHAKNVIQNFTVGGSLPLKKGERNTVKSLLYIKKLLA